MVRCWISLVLLAVAVPAWADDALWALLSKGGQVVLVRHGLTTPGVGDPPGFKLGECATQRNLVDQGRRIETARIALGTDPALDDTLSNLFDHSANREKQVAQFRKLVAKAPAQGNLFLVTHGSTTAAFTGINQGTAEMVIVTPEGGERYRVAGRLAVQ